MKDYFYISLIAMLSFLWNYATGWNFNIKNKPLWVNPQKIYIQEDSLVSIVRGRHNNFLVFSIDGRKFRASCKFVIESSEPYKEICDNRYSKTIIAKNIIFLDVTPPRLDGIILKGDFFIDNKSIHLDINEGNKEKVNDFIKHKKFDIYLFYAFFLLPAMYVVYYLFFTKEITYDHINK